jgi:energy-coupling factor transporter ATP-binding protein EcfA2
MRFKGSYVILETDWGRVCVKKVMKVVNVSTAVQDLDDVSSAKYLKAYVNSLNLGFPMEFHTFVKPVDRVEYVKTLERIYVESSVVYEVNPMKTDSRVRAERAKALRDRILRDSIQPFEVEAYVATSACGEDVDSATNVVEMRARLLKGVLSALGIEVEEVSSEDFAKTFNMVLYEDSGILTRFMRRLKRGLTIVDRVTLPVLTHIPLLGRARAALRSRGIKLGVDVESGESVYWNMEESTSPHVLVVGPSGIGKTTFLARLSREVGKAGVRVLIVDPRNEYSTILGSLGADFKRLELGRDLALGLWEVVRLLGLQGQEPAEVLLEILSTHGELGRREVFPCLYNSLKSSSIAVGNDAEFLSVVRSYLRYCQDDYSEYLVGKVLLTLSELSGSGSLVELLREGRGVYVVDVSRALSADPYVVPLLMKVLSTAIRAVFREPQHRVGYHTLVVIDEAWSVMREPRHISIVEELIRVGRGYGVPLALATQTVADLAKSVGALLDSIGLLVVMPSTSIEYWREVRKIARVSWERIERMRSLGRGYALVRIAPDPRSIIVKLEVS